MKSALIVVDIQNEYFANGGFPQWNIDKTSANIAEKIKQAKADGWLVVGVQHFIPGDDAPLFRKGSPGANIHTSVAGLLADAPLVEKVHADSFLNTDMGGILKKEGITDLYICGMMTQNCITHTAISPHASGFNVHVIANCCTAPSELVHILALEALADRGVKII
ncbi:isochorismatase family protein [Neisseria wadsworthii]|uniref:isochorismatase family protein n=1 Tax=Neisseria wadsworthii TaxID=607711 RepID=UPI000D3210C5|nr:isochorismatase family protein [Neisseria wadsworthii]